MAFDATGAPQYGLKDGKIASRTSLGVYGTAVDIMSIQELGGTLKVLSAELPGDDQITATMSKIIGGDLRLKMGGITLAVLEVMFGTLATSSIVSPNNVKQLRFAGGASLPLFGIVGQSSAAEGSGDFLVFYPKCRIMGDVPLLRQVGNTFADIEVTISLLPDETYGVMVPIERETAGTYTLPPANI